MRSWNSLRRGTSPRITTEHESFVNCIGVPVRDGTGAVVAAVSMSVPDMLLDHEQVLAALPQVRAAADAISDELGWSPAA